MRSERRSFVVASHAGIAAFVFGALEVAALPLILRWGRRWTWFTIDDWDFLAQRTGGNLGDLFRSHQGHWTTVPVLAYRALWQLAGLEYLPYQLLVLLLHLAAAALLRVVMRRAGVGPWLATFVAGIFVFFGYGAENTLVAFQMTFVGSFVFGLVHLLLADHDGSVTRRDAFGICAGLLALMCSNVGVVMVLVVAIAVLLRRGWRIASLHALPLGGIYLLWYLSIGRNARIDVPTTPSRVVRFFLIGVQTTFAKLGQLPGVGVLLFALLATGLVIVSSRHEHGALTRERAASIALLCGVVIFMIMTALGRSGPAAFAGSVRLPGPGGPEHARQSHYIYITVGMCLPAIAVAAQAIIERWRAMTLVVVVALGLGIPGNLHDFSHNPIPFQSYRQARRDLLALPDLTIAQQLPRSLVPVGLVPTVGFLLDADRGGHLPNVPSFSPQERANLTARVALQRTPLRVQRDCRRLVPRSIVVIRSNQTLMARRGSFSVTYVATGEPPSSPIVITEASPRIAVVGPLRLRLDTTPGRPTPATVCIA